MKYGFITKLVDFDGEKVWVAESTDLKGCIGQGESIESAIAELAENETFWLEIAENRGIDIPQPTVVDHVAFSGKLTLRLGARLHKETAECAKNDGLSINNYITNAVASYNSTKSTATVAAHMIRDAETKIMDRFSTSYKLGVNIFDPNASFRYHFQPRS